MRRVKLGIMLTARNVRLLTDRSLPKRYNHLNKGRMTPDILPAFTSLSSQKFHPYLNGLDVDLMLRDFRTNLSAVYQGWEKVYKHVTSKRVAVTFVLANFILLIAANGFNYSEKIAFAKGETLIAAAGSAGPVMSATITTDTVPTFGWPNTPEYISTYFSFWHPGIDIVNPQGTPIKPVTSGTVTGVANEWFGYGKNILITHDGGYSSRYAHLSQINVKLGQTITADTIIGLIGSTGHSTGNHLHLEIHFEGKPINPMNVLPQINVANYPTK